MFHALAQKLRQLLAPHFCIHCTIMLEKEGWWCVDCAARVRSLVSKTIAVTPSFSMPVFCVGAYEEPLKQLILSKSWSHRTSSYLLGELIWQKTPISLLSFDYIVPVPLHWRRFAWRGYNQAECMAEVISTYSKKPIIRCVKRNKSTPFQSSLAIENRAANVHEAFRFVPTEEIEEGKTFLIVDDLMTTGSTLKSVAHIIRKSCKSKSIIAVVAARAV